MDDQYFEGFAAGPRTARQKHTLGTKGVSRTRAISTQHLTDEFFGGFVAGPRAAR
jgi:hypothetical protein